MQSVAAAVDRLRTLAAIPEIDQLSRRFAEAGFELALVGGSVRDAFLDREIADLDFTTDARPDEILAIVAPIADAHWDIGREFGTIGARLGDAHGRDHHLPQRRLRRRDPQAGRGLR